MSSCHRPDPLLIPACLALLSGELTRMTVLGELRVDPRPQEEGAGWRPQTAVETGQPTLYSIRVPQRPATVVCPRGGHEFRAAGPTGYADDRPISDYAMLEACRELGMLLALAAVARAFGKVSLRAPRDGREALLQLGAFARVYEMLAAESGPARPFDLPTEPLGEDG